ncbi:MAG: sigma-70 family RNA polymerase sigma factor [Rikenellaceae bacterium]|nr:sigma-70 family RNA polymerase sigma factor [Rikenellaceae bacterium]MCL2691807.1 sigma-70 family RNA polymerase sigma factor [Rikenellaceae bacterium]
MLKKFNRREIEAFGYIYDYFYSELTYYTIKIYKDTGIDAADVIHDIFLKVWHSPKKDFSSLEEIKFYMMVSIKNSRKALTIHQKHIDRYADAVRTERDQFKLDIIETEIFSVFNYALGLPPKETAEIFKLFLEGYTAEEIAWKTGKTVKAIYNLKSRTLAGLKRQLSHHQFSILSLLLF